MKTEAIQRCIDNGSDIRDAVAAQIELAAIEKALDAKDDAMRLAVHDSFTAITKAFADRVIAAADLCGDADD